MADELLRDIRQPRDFITAGIPCITAPREPAIATAKDSWWRMVPSPSGWGAPRQGRAQASALLRPWALLDGPLPPRASFSSQPASLAVPLPAGPRERGLAQCVEQQLRPPPPDAPTRSAA